MFLVASRVTHTLLKLYFTLITRCVCVFLMALEAETAAAHAKWAPVVCVVIRWCVESVLIVTDVMVSSVPPPR